MTSAAIQKAAADMQASQRAVEAQLTQAGVQAQGWSHDVVMVLSIGVMLLTALALITATVVLRKQNVAGAGEIVKVFGLILIIALSTMLVIVGYSSEQLTAIIGLFGAIAGYLASKDTKP